VALINCPECNKEISDKAAACIGCGCPVTHPPPFPSESSIILQPPHAPTSNSVPSGGNINVDDIVAICGNDRARAVALYKEATGLSHSEAMQIILNAYNKKESQNFQTSPKLPFSSGIGRHYSSSGVKTAKLVCGIISIAVFMIIIFQSCAAGFVNMLESNVDDFSGAAGAVLAVLMLIGGIVGITTRNSRGGGITAGVFYLVGGIIGIVSLGTFTDLIVWSILSIAFSLLFIVGSVEKTSSKIIWAVLILLPFALPMLNTTGIIGDREPAQNSSSDIRDIATTPDEEGFFPVTNEVSPTPSPAVVNNQNLSGLSDLDDAVLIHDDDYVSIRYLGCEINRNREYMVFHAENKTNVEVTFQANTLSINGESLGYVSGSDSIAAQSRGRIRFRTADPFPTMSPSTITGTLRVIDFSRELFRSYDVSFVNIEIGG
jgi:hypothetical protein